MNVATPRDLVTWIGLTDHKCYGVCCSRYPRRVPPTSSDAQRQPLPLGVQKGVFLRDRQTMNGGNTAVALGFTPLFLINV